jgi:mono/diheme cytochrome c family protein
MWRRPAPGAGVMQGLSEKQISDEEIRALVAYLTLLK